MDKMPVFRFWSWRSWYWPCLVLACSPVRDPEPAARSSIWAATSVVAAPSRPSASPLIAPAQPEPPAYDLDQDLLEREVEAKRDLGRRATVRVLEDVFVLGAPGTGLGGAAGVADQALGAYFHGRFSRRPARAVSVYLFPSAAPYDAYCRGRWQGRCSSSFGFYLRDERRIVMNVGPGVGTLTHELVHPILEADFPGAPDWLEEGIASLYEGFALGRPGDIRGVKNWRHPRLLIALGSPRERDDVNIERLFGMSDQVFRDEREDLHYALARYFCLWLEQRELLWPFYHRWRDHVAEDPSGRQAFEAVVGEPPTEATAAFLRWVRGI